jgi:phospholipid-translocating ATPase
VPLVCILSVAPRYLAKAYKIAYHPNDFDIIRYILKRDPQYDFSHEAAMRSPFSGYPQRPSSALSHTRTESFASLPRPSMDLRSASRTDMSTGARSVHRGFDFSTEENGVAIRRLQSNLSERRASSRNVNFLQTDPAPKRKRNNVLTVGKNFIRKKASLKKYHSKDHSRDED